VESRNETARIEGFSDAVFAIAITLLGLDLRVPPPGSQGLLAKVLAQWPEYLAFVASFGTIAVWWIMHHRLFTLIRRSNHALLLLNCLVLLWVTVIPYPTRMVAAYVGTPDLRVAAMLHAATFVMIAACFKLLWWYVSVHGHLLNPDVDARTIRVINGMSSFAPLMYVVSLLLASVNVTVSATLNLALAVFLAIPK